MMYSILIYKCSFNFHSEEKILINFAKYFVLYKKENNKIMTQIVTIRIFLDLGGTFFPHSLNVMYLNKSAFANSNLLEQFICYVQLNAFSIYRQECIVKC